MRSRVQTKGSKRQKLINREINRIVDKFEIEDWDLLLIGDGSGNTWGNACGWATVLIRAHDRQPLSFRGGMSHGTNNVGELMAYIHPLLWYINTDLFRRAKGRGETRKAHIVTDSEYVATSASRPQHHHKANRAIFACLDSIRREGMDLIFHWMRREESSFNRFADRESRRCRLAVDGLKVSRKG